MILLIGLRVNIKEGYGRINMKPDRRQSERRSFNGDVHPIFNLPHQVMERRLTIIKAGRRFGEKERRSPNRLADYQKRALQWEVKNMREKEK